MHRFPGENVPVRAAGPLPLYPYVLGLHIGSHPDSWGRGRKLARAQAIVPVPSLGRLRLRPSARKKIVRSRGSH